MNTIKQNFTNKAKVLNQLIELEQKHPTEFRIDWKNNSPRTILKKKIQQQLYANHTIGLVNNNNYPNIKSLNNLNLNDIKNQIKTNFKQNINNVTSELLENYSSNNVNMRKLYEIPQSEFRNVVKNQFGNVNKNIQYV